MNTLERIPYGLICTLRRRQLLPTRYILSVSVATQNMRLFERRMNGGISGLYSEYTVRQKHVISSSAFGTGQKMHSNQTPLGLHRIAQKIGGGQPIGTVFRSRKAVGRIWGGMPDGAIAHRILWLEGLEEGYNRGGEVDTFKRYVYIHGFGDESTLGRPASHGCIHLAAKDLIPLFDLVPVGTMVWIFEG